MRSARLLAVAVLAVVLALSSAQNAFGVTTLFYDDGIANNYLSPTPPSSTALAVKFVLSDFSLSSTNLLGGRYYIFDRPRSFEVRVYDSDGAKQLCCSPALVVTPTGTGWFTVDLAGYNIVVSGAFYLIIWYSAVGPTIGFHDSAPSHSRSYIFLSGSGWSSWGYDLMIRADVGQPAPPEEAPPVGGVVVPANTLVILGPWLAVIGLVGCIGIVVAVAMKRRS